MKKLRMSAFHVSLAYCFPKGGQSNPMKKLLFTAIVLALGTIATGNALADGHHHSRVGVGIVVGGPYWGPWYAPPPPPVYYYPPYYPPVVIERPAPPVYIEQAPVVEAKPAAGYWYYCQASGGYYPNIRECPQGWVKVLPRP